MQDLHTYAVGKDRWVVHNSDICPIDQLGLDVSKKVTVVGRGMTRVKKAAQALEDAGFEVNTWEP